MASDPSRLKSPTFRQNEQTPEMEKVQEQSSRGRVVLPQQVTDRSIIDSVADFISDVVPAASIISSTFDSSSTTSASQKDVIQWAQFEQIDNEFFHMTAPIVTGGGLTSSSASGSGSGSSSNLSGLSDQPQHCRLQHSSSPVEFHDTIAACPLFLILGYANGVQIWAIEMNGKAVEVMSWRDGPVKLLKFLPTPSTNGVRSSELDLYCQKRPLVAFYESSSHQSMYQRLIFLSLKTGEQVHQIKFTHTIVDVQANKKSIVVVFSERLAVFSASTLGQKAIVTTCYPSPGLCVNPISLGSRWLAYAENRLDHTLRSAGGNETDHLESYTTTVLNAAKSIGKGLFDFGGSVAYSLTGSHKPHSPNPLSSPGSGHGSSETNQAGIVTILDIENVSLKENRNETDFVAHFVANSEPIVQLKFDYSGQLLICADKRGHDFHIFQIFANSLGSHLAAVHHLYILHRGDTTATVQDVCFSHDSRWVTVSTTRGTSHVFAITPYGGPISLRTHSTSQVVNRLSRYHQSAGLTTSDGKSNSPLPDLPQNSQLPYANPRLSPYPQPTTVYPLAQIRQPISLQLPSSGLIQRSTSTGRQRLISLSDETSGHVALRLTTCFAKRRTMSGDYNISHGQSLKLQGQQNRFNEVLYIFSNLGLLTEYDLHAKPSSVVSKEKICESTPIELDIDPRAQWILQRSSTDTDLKPPLSKNNILLKYGSGQSQHGLAQSSLSNNWLSQIEILTHVGPHRRLWMGPQFIFKVCNNQSLSRIASKMDSDCELIEIDVYATRTKATSIAETPSLIMECDSQHNSYEQLFDFPVKYKGDYSVPDDVQLRENLADAMLDISSTNISLDKSAASKQSASKAHVLKKVVNPLGTVVTLREDDDNNIVTTSPKTDKKTEVHTDKECPSEEITLRPPVMLVTEKEQSLDESPVPESVTEPEPELDLKPEPELDLEPEPELPGPSVPSVSKKSKKVKSKLGVKLSEIPKRDRDEDNAIFDDELNLNLDRCDIEETAPIVAPDDAKSEADDSAKVTKKKGRRNKQRH